MSVPRPLGLVAELTYRCPLRCPYCSNPVDASGEEIRTEEWARVLREAGELGLVHALFTGGEPLLRADLEELISAARAAGLYTNLITSGWGLTSRRAEELRQAGLDSVQLSLQADEAMLADDIAGAAAHERKLDVARVVRDMGWPLTLNVVLHRANVRRVSEILALAMKLGAIRLELASTQFYGWAFRNRAVLLPSRADVEAAEAVIAAHRRAFPELPIVYVGQDVYAGRPKPCMNGWGQRYIVVNPAGEAMPCGSAHVIRGMRFDNVRQRPLGAIWSDSEAFNRFRGTAWMQAPCATCDRREVDFGGCRCQAALVAGDAAQADPACALSSAHAAMAAAGGAAGVVPLGRSFGSESYRVNPRPSGP